MTDSNVHLVKITVGKGMDFGGLVFGGVSAECQHPECKAGEVGTKKVRYRVSNFYSVEDAKADALEEHGDISLIFDIVQLGTD